MDENFKPYVEQLAQKLEKLRNASAANPLALPPDMCAKGVYVFSEGETYLYVGRSNTLRNRIRSHCGASSGHNAAVFAFKLARIATGWTKPHYKKGSGGTRDELMHNERFLGEFAKAKDRIGAMDVRYVEETDPIRQALLEIYAAVVLGAKYNDFDNH